MESSLYCKAPIRGNIDMIFRQTKDQCIPNSNTILHLASQFGQTEAVHAILFTNPSLLSEVNSNGDSALHLAARGGHASIVRVIIACAKALDSVQDVETGQLQTWRGILRLENKQGDTALHEATRKNHIQVVRMLLEEDTDFEYLRNRSGESPLYLAASRGFHDLVDLIIEAGGSPSYYGPDGRTALHGAVICNSQDCARKLLEWRKTLVSFKDNYSQTPLHYAVRLGFASIVSELLSADESIGYIADNDGNTPLHLLATSNCFVPKFIQYSMLTKEALNNNNLTSLNLVIYDVDNKSTMPAAQKETAEELKCVGAISHLPNVPAPTPTPVLAPTPVPLACIAAPAPSPAPAPASFDHITAIAPSTLSFRTTLSPPALTLSMDFAGLLKRNLSGAHLPPRHPAGGSSRPPLNGPAPIVPPATQNSPNTSVASATGQTSPPPNPQGSNPSIPSVTDSRVSKMAENHMIVAALIATVAFTAGFTMPGGYISSGSLDQGMAVLSTKSIAFQAFIISDTVALLFSTSALFMYFLAANYEVAERTDTVGNFALGGMFLNMFGLGAMIVSFITGTYAVLQHSPALAIAASIVASCILLIYLVLLSKFFIDACRCCCCRR